MPSPSTSRPSRLAPSAGAPGPLTRREHEVVTLLAEGLTNGEIGRRLHLSPRTVQAHVARAFEKLGARSRTQLAVEAIRRGIVPLHQAGDGGTTRSSPGATPTAATAGAAPSATAPGAGRARERSQSGSRAGR